MMGMFHVARRQIRHWIRYELSLLLFTIAITSILNYSHVCASSDEVVEQVPTLKEIYGGVPKNSFPVVRRDARILQSNTESSTKRAEPISESLRRGLRSKPHTFTVPVTDISASEASFYAQLQIGTPPQTLLLVLDTGSTDLWAQSKQCTECFTELLPRYDPTMSSTFEEEIVSGSPVPWNISYGDGGANFGYLARETLTIDSGDGKRIVIPEFQFAISVNNTGQNDEYSGIMGLMPVSPTAPSPFLAQLETLSNGTYRKFSKQFRYCFPDRTTQYSTTSFLSFGNIDESDTDSLFSATKHLHKSQTLWTPIVPNLPYSFYALNMTAITVAGNRIPIDPQELTLESVQNQTMTIIDSGTTITQLREPYFSQFVTAYYNATLNLASETFLQDLTFNISTDVFDGYLFPSLSFIFQKWQQDGDGERQEEIEVFLPKNNVLVSLPNGGYQLAFLRPTNNLNIIGNYAQESFLIDYDLEKSRVGFLRVSCTFD